MTHIIETDKQLSIIFESNLDSMYCLAFEPQLKDMIINKKAVVFDLEKVEFVSSAFLRLCLASSQTIGIKNFAIINASPALQKVFTTAGMGYLIRDEKPE